MCLLAHRWDRLSYGIELWLLEGDSPWRLWAVAPASVPDEELAFISASLQECRTVEDAEALLRDMRFLETAWS